MSRVEGSRAKGLRGLGGKGDTIKGGGYKANSFLIYNTELKPIKVSFFEKNIHTYYEFEKYLIRNTYKKIEEEKIVHSLILNCFK